MSLFMFTLNTIYVDLMFVIKHYLCDLLCYIICPSSSSITFCSLFFSSPRCCHYSFYKLKLFPETCCLADFFFLPAILLFTKHRSQSHLIYFHQGDGVNTIEKWIK